MSVSNGQIADQNTFNNAYLSKQSDNVATGKTDLSNTDGPSGAAIVNIQKKMNDNTSASTTNASNIATNVTDIATNASSITNLTADEIAETNTRYFDIKNNHSAIVNPVITDDGNSNYVVGSMWYNIVNGNVFLASDVTAGAAVWNNITNQSVHYIGTMPNGVNDWPDGTWRILDVAGLLTFEKKVSSVWTKYFDMGE